MMWGRAFVTVLGVLATLATTRVPLPHAPIDAWGDEAPATLPTSLSIAALGITMGNEPMDEQLRQATELARNLRAAR